MSDFLDGADEIQKHGRDLPHWQQGEVMQFVTFRLGDSMPESKIRKWKEERLFFLNRYPKPWSAEQEADYHKRFTWKLEGWLDEGAGSCLLQNPANRQILSDILMRFQSERVDHQAWVIMPNHVHLLFTPAVPLETLIKAWKGTSAHRIGQGSIWQKNYRDTLIRDSGHFGNAVRYIRRNPAKLRPDTFTLWESPRALAVK
ncbi:transposase [Luteolibacter sp. Populi]|uniref:transposase n=1 Tax=Luteolibacter sp. Populi TaxID=3230487 RepID=UPI0034654D1E